MLSSSYQQRNFPTSGDCLVDRGVAQVGVRVAPPATRTTSSLLSQLSTTTQDHPFSSEDFLISFATVITTVANAIVI